MRGLMWLVVLVPLTFGCGGELKPGFSECGSESCAPGTYCQNAQAEICAPGCTSDLNCLSNEVCYTDEFTGTGTCYKDESTGTETGSDTGSDTGTGTDSETETDGALADCLEACDSFGGCGLPPDEVLACKDGCRTWTEDQRQTIANCGDQVGCLARRECLGVQCFSDSDCVGDDVCFDGSCL